ncbi:MAG: sulfate adenylyltransferase subunit 1 [Paraglaciecola sp.]|jgi:sulfate adenylyltransferase subunit 1
MNSENTLLQSDILGYLDQHEKKDMLRFLTCGSVDDGKSTLIGRLLHDSKMIFEDQLAAITKDSKKMGTTGDKVDLALLVDGLQSEREQGITIDVAYRYYSTDKRKFIIADTPGHEQYTRNMVTGASNCDVAIILIDARAGVKTQTRRHSFLVSLLGIKHVIVAVNKMDLKDYSETIYEEIKADYLQFSEQLEIPDIQFIPLSALDGDNVVNVSENTPWYKGETLMTMLEQVEINDDINADDFRFPVQYVNRPNLNFRGFAGTVVSGQIKPGDSITALPSGKQSKVKALVNFEGEQDRVYAPLTTTITLEDEIDISRGDMIVKSDNLPLHSNTFKTNLVWMDEEPMMPNKQYGFKFATKFVPGSVTEVEYQIDVNSMEHKKTVRLALNEIAVGKIKLTQPVACDPYTKNRSTGAFIIIDRVTNGTVGAGMIIDVAEDTSAGQFSEFELEFNDLVRKHFPHWNATDISKM